MSRLKNTLRITHFADAWMIIREMVARDNWVEAITGKGTADERGLARIRPGDKATKKHKRRKRQISEFVLCLLRLFVADFLFV
jgi:hypothetical protein